MLISPTVGRVVWYRPTAQDPGASQVGDQPHAAIVTHVWNDTCVNLAVFDCNGQTYGRTSVPLLQGDAKPPADSAYCEWMPFQKGQAAKTDAAEAQLKTQAGKAEKDGADTAKK